MAHADPQESEAESQKVDGKDGEAEPLGNCGKIVVVKTRVVPVRIDQIPRSMTQMGILMTTAG